MKKYKLSNGLTIIEERKQSDSVTVNININVGSNDEKKGIRGISHFIEHMVFEGTKNRKNSRIISNEIERLGGELNAYTDNTRTCFYIKVPKKHFVKAVEILSDIMKNPLFGEKEIEKERQVILKEINIFYDESRFYQWILFMGALYSKHPARFPAYGDAEDVRKISREQLVSYFNDYYAANNAIISVVGDAENIKQILKEYFSDFRKGKKINRKKFLEPQLKKIKKAKIKRRLMNSYMVMGYKTVAREHKDSFVLDVIQGILGRGQSGRVFDEIRNKRGLAYEVGVQHEASTDFGYLGVYLSADKKNMPLIRKIIRREMDKLRDIGEKEVKEAIGFVEGKYILDAEDTEDKADQLGFWEQIKDAKLQEEYLDKIRKVRKKDVRRVAKKYLCKQYALAIIEQK